MSNYYTRKAMDARADIAARILLLEQTVTRLTEDNAALQRDYHAVTARLRTSEDHADWLHKVATRMYRHLEELNVDSYTLTALNVALKIDRPTDD